MQFHFLGRPTAGPPVLFEFSLILLMFLLPFCIRAAAIGPFGQNMVHLQRRDLKSDFGVYVVDRQTNVTSYEESPFAVRIAMKLLFGTWLVSSPFVRLQMMLQTKIMGAYDDSTRSAANIPSFVNTYNISTQNLLQPNLSAYETFNEFFYRKLAPNARPIDSPGDPTVLVSASDCRLTVWKTVDEATNIWIKGKSFSISNLLSNETAANDYTGGSLAIFRLAPQDYHRFHAPTNMTLESLLELSGQYYTVNPMAIKENLDVLTDNKRTVAIFDSPNFGKIAYVMIGALLVASINLTIKVGDTVQKGGEIGYFAYGGSTIVTLFQKNKVTFDADLASNSMSAMETVVEMGEHIGTTFQSS